MDGEEGKEQETQQVGQNERGGPGKGRLEARGVALAGPALRGVWHHRPVPVVLTASDGRPRADPQRTARGPVSLPPLCCPPASDSQLTEDVTPTVMWNLQRDPEGADRRPAGTLFPCAGATGHRTGTGSQPHSCAAMGWRSRPVEPPRGRLQLPRWGGPGAWRALLAAWSRSFCQGPPRRGQLSGFVASHLFLPWWPEVLVSSPKIISQANHDSVF